MGAQFGAGRDAFTNEPNVVPMIDILLVLLIIFMMQVPLQRKAMDVNLPPEQQVEQQQQQSIRDQIVLQLMEDGSYAINSEPVAFSNLGRRLREIYDNRPTKLMFIKTAGNRVYEEVIEAMDIARGAGVQVIGFTPSETGEDGN
ncbi:MAG: biopolymer transporter ExbD [Gemmatimonadetes bacterium]|nr:biopolymer transporter ExbD [Gemmatimonadota bacterium]